MAERGPFILTTQVGLRDAVVFIEAERAVSREYPDIQPIVRDVYQMQGGRRQRHDGAGSRKQRDRLEVAKDANPSRADERPPVSNRYYVPAVSTRLAQPSPSADRLAR
jgi:hypothetical protein